MKQKISKSLLLKTLLEEWRVWLVIIIFLTLILIFSNQLAKWLKESTFINVLDSLGKLGILVAVIAFLREISKWEKRAIEESNQRRFEYWKTIDTANIARESSRYGRFTSHALRIALENLTKEKDKKGNPMRIGPIDVSGADLQGIDLKNAYFYVAGFRGSNLSNANFYRANFEKAYFQRSRLFGTDFRDAIFQNQVLFIQALYDNDTKFPNGFDPVVARAYKISPKANLQHAILENAMLWDAQLIDADLQHADLRGAIIGGDLSRVKLQHANLSKAKLGDANLESANFYGSNLIEAAFYRANLNNVNFQNANIQDTSFTDSNISRANFQGVSNITVEQIKEAVNWEKAIYDDTFLKKLGLPK